MKRIKHYDDVYLAMCSHNKEMIASTLRLLVYHGMNNLFIVEINKNTL